MPLEITRNDILKIQADAIVDPTDMLLSGSGSVDRLIHEKAGEGLKTALEGLYLEEGEALMTESFECDNCRYIIHTCGPVYEDGRHDEDEILRSCYRECLRLCREYELESVAFPLIASGSFMFPKGRALKIATDTITEFLLDNEMNVALLVYDREAFDTANKLYTDIQSYLDETEVKAEVNYGSHRRSEQSWIVKPKECKTVIHEEKSPEEASFEPDESFSQCLVRMIDKKKLRDPDVYKRANISRKHFNKLINDKNAKPKKETVVALAIGMKLNLRDTRTLMERAGYALSDSFVFDKIIRYCIAHKIYNIFDVNELLFYYDQKTLGC